VPEGANRADRKRDGRVDPHPVEDAVAQRVGHARDGGEIQEPAQRNGQQRHQQKLQAESQQESPWETHDLQEVRDA
jgi:hypothetical protein